MDLKQPMPLDEPVGRGVKLRFEAHTINSTPCSSDTGAPTTRSASVPGTCTTSVSKTVLPPVSQLPVYEVRSCGTLPLAKFMEKSSMDASCPCPLVYAQMPCCVDEMLVHARICTRSGPSLEPLRTSSQEDVEEDMLRRYTLLSGTVKAYRKEAEGFMNMLRWNPG
jgi:hypothetical protein